MHALITDAFRWWVKARPDAPALSLDDETLSYRQLDRWSDQVAHDLLQRGVKVGDVVGIGGQNSVEWCVVALGCVKAGVTLAPFSYRFTSREIDMLVEDCEPIIVYVDATQKPKLEELLDKGRRFQLLSIEDVRAMEAGLAKPAPLDASPDLPVAIVYTSGTTGRPKGVIYSHRTSLSFIAEMLFKEPIPPEDFRLLFVLPLFTMGGLFYSFLQTLSRGGWVTVTRTFDAAEALRLLVERRISYMPAVPGIWEQIALQPGFEGLDLSHLRFASAGGARVSPKMLEAYFDRGVRLRHMYGMTEIGGYGTLPRPEAAMERPDTCGDGSIFTQFRVVAPDGSPVAAGDVGEILLRGPAMTPAYWNNPSATAELIVDGWIHTGDLGTIDESGRLKFVDRKKDMIISGGFNISPIEVENVIIEFEGIEEVAVIPVPDAKFGETPAALIFCRKPVNIPDLIQTLNSKLADFKVPRYVVSVDEPLPRMLSGKVARRDLTARYATIPEEFARVR